MNFKRFHLKNKNFIKFKVLFITSFLLYFFSNNLAYAQNLQNNEPKYLIPIGNVLQIDAELKNIIVREVSGRSPFNLGDSIVKIDNKFINGYSDFAQTIASLNSGNEVSVVVNRNNSLIKINTTKEILENMHFNNLLSGFATLTYVDPDSKKFGAVGHAISFGASKKIPIRNGSISTTSNLNIEKSEKGTVGYINATRNNTIGNFTNNTNFGIQGDMVDFDISNLKQYKVASLNEIYCGKAQIILQTDSCNSKKYDIEILNVERKKYPESKTFKIKITDKELLSQTGGIVQGMSGTPIVQDNKIIGAISHAVENDPAIGYGVFIRWMLNN